MSTCLKEIDELIAIFSEYKETDDIAWDNHEIYLFKQESVEYTKLFNKISTFFVPVFDFEYLTNGLSSIINNISAISYSGIVVTSPRSVHALNKVLIQNNIDSSIYKLPIPIYTFGSKTPKLIDNLLPKSECIVFTSNNSNSMALLLIDHLNEKYENNQIPPLLILFGERHRTELTNQLDRHQIKYQETIVYKTVNLSQLSHINNMDYINKTCCWVFFSPNGVDVVMKYLRNNKFNINGIKKYIQCGTLGNTTANKLKQIEWNASFIANKPNAQSLYNAWYSQILQQK